VLIVTGPVGVGKATVACEAAELLRATGVAYAMVDFDTNKALRPATILSVSEADEQAWLAEHRRRVAAFPPDVRGAHLHSFKHRTEIVTSSICGCFYCCSVFNPSLVDEWVDEDASGQGQTALCPKCGVDSVIGERSGAEISVEFMKKMRTYWF
jgi:hypothetical protein